MGSFYSQFFVTPEYPSQPLTGQTVIVTGSNVGLGLEAARHIVRLDAARVILAVRNVAAGHEAKRSIEESTGRADVCEVWELDLASYDSVIAFAERASKLPRLDVVLQNAALATTKFALAEGHERSITVNVISTFLLGLLVLPKLRESAARFATRPRLTIVTSEMHSWPRMPEWTSENTFAALDDEPNTNIRERYAVSKLLEVLVVREWVTRMAESPVVVNMLNPGLCHSQLMREGGWAGYLLKLVAARSTEVGSRTLVASAAAGAESHGAYMTDGKVANNALSAFVCSQDGEKAQKKVWAELAEILESIRPGVTRNL
ncbi:short-chain dehydrogenase reductase [Aspergillus sp. HF37]|nr:short-chain dehydrogenase reductase [Aspergillus sp. HF37]